MAGGFMAGFSNAIQRDGGLSGAFARKRKAKNEQRKQLEEKRVKDINLYATLSTDKNQSEEIRVDSRRRLNELLGIPHAPTNIADIDAVDAVRNTVFNMKEIIKKNEGKPATGQYLDSLKSLAIQHGDDHRVSGMLKGATDAHAQTIKNDIAEGVAIFSKMKENGGKVPLGYPRRMAILKEKLQGRTQKDIRTILTGISELEQNPQADPLTSLTGDIKNRAIATELEKQGDPRGTQAITASDKAKLERSRVQGTFQQEAKVSNVESIIKEINPLVDRIFTSESFFDRVVDGVKNATSIITQEGAKATDIAQYRSLIDGIAGQFAKVVSGEGGRLTDQDIARVKGLFPDLFGIFGAPDNEKVAKRKMDFLSQSLENELKRILKAQGKKVPDDISFGATSKVESDFPELSTEEQDELRQLIGEK